MEMKLQEQNGKEKEVLPSHTLKSKYRLRSCRSFNNLWNYRNKSLGLQRSIYKKDVENEKKERVKNATTSKN